MTEAEFQRRLQLLRDLIAKERASAEIVNQHTRHRQEDRWMYDERVAEVFGLENALRIMETGSL